MKHYLAVDTGAENRRIIRGTLENNLFSIRKFHRFSNGMITINKHYHWYIAGIYAEILKGIEICVHQEHIVPDNIGIDTWGVDYGLLAEDGSLMGLPFAYRDPRTGNAIEELCKKISKKKIYAATGNLFASYNTLFQLFAAKKFHPKMTNAASDMLFSPDLLTYFLTVVKKPGFHLLPYIESLFVSTMMKTKYSVPMHELHLEWIQKDQTTEPETFSNQFINKP